jgi:hypothetical protein
MEKQDQHTQCPKCHEEFICKPGEFEQCFCSSIIIPGKILNYMKTKFNTCLCGKCINELIANQHKIFSLIIFFLLLNQHSFAQFHAAPGSTYTSAMYKDSSAFVAWAKTCTVTRGWEDAADHSLGTATVGVDANGTLKAGINSVVSLGDGGIAILTFSNTIKNGPGNDFAVFENGFSDNFLELAFVEVSSDGINFVRFPATSNTQFTTQVGAFDPLDCTKLNNLAGKYRVDYGTPFDLEEVKNAAGLNVNAITHVKIIDVVGSITPSLATYDMNNHPVNDPYPTAFGSGGFDLDAVGVINENPAGLEAYSLSDAIHVFPNPANNKLFIRSSLKENFSYTITDINGRTMSEGNYDSFVNLNLLNNGIYFIRIDCSEGNTVKKFIVSH